MAVVTINLKAVNQYQAEFNKLNQQLGKISGTANQQFGSVQKGFSGVQKAVLGGVAAIGGLQLGKSIAGGFAEGIKAAATFEQNMADTAAILGVPIEKTKELGKFVTDLAIDPMLRVSSDEAAEAVNLLARNGLEMGEIMGGAARSTVLLANATGANFGQAADIATDAMALFNIGVGDMSTAVNSMSGVVTSSKFDINDYALFLAQAGGVAAGVGVEWEDFNTIMAATSESFNSGSDAGTSFKTFLQRLVPQTNAQADKMRALGLFTGLTTDEFTKQQAAIEKTQKKIAELDPTSKKYEENLLDLNNQLSAQQRNLVAGNSAFFDANGNMESMLTISNELTKALAGLTEEQRTEALTVLFGTDAMRTGLALMNLTNDEYIEMAKNVNELSDAEVAAATRQATTSAHWETFKDILVAIRREANSHFLPALDSVILKMTGLAVANREAVVKSFERVSNAIPFAGDALGELMAQFVTFNFDVFDTTEGIYNFGRALGYSHEQMTGVTTSIFNAATAWQEFAKPIKDILGSFYEFRDVATAVGLVIGAALLGPLSGITIAAAGLGLKFAALTTAVAGFRNTWEADWGGIRTATTKAVNAVLPRIKQLGANLLTNVIPQMRDRITVAFKTIEPMVESVVTSITRGTALRDARQKLTESLTKLFGEGFTVGSAFTTLRTKISESLGNLFGDNFSATGAFVKLRSRILTGLTNLFGDEFSFSGALTGIKTKLTEGLQNLFGKDFSLSGALSGIKTKLTEGFANLFGEDFSLTDSLAGIKTKLTEGFTNLFGEDFSLMGALSSLKTKVTDGMKALFGEDFSLTGTLSGLKTKINDGVSTAIATLNLTSTFSGLLPKIGEGLTSAIQTTFSAGSGLLSNIFGPMLTDAQQSVARFQETFSFTDFLSGILPQIFNGVRSMVSSVASFLTEGFAEVAPELGQFLGSGLANLLKGSFAVVATAITGGANAIAGALVGLVEGFNSPALASGIVSFVANFVDGFVQELTGIDLSTKLSGFVEQVSGIFESIGDAISAVTPTIESITGLFGGGEGGGFNLLGMLGGGLGGGGLSGLFAGAMPEFEWPALPEFDWPTIPEFDWPTLPEFDWPSLPEWSWPSLPKWSWPSLPTLKIDFPGFLNPDNNALGGHQRHDTVSRINEFGQEAVIRNGKAFYPEGDYTYLRRGDYVVTAAELRNSSNAGSVGQPQLAGAGAMMGGGGITINMGGVTIANNMDINTVARQVAEKIQRRLR